MSTTPEKQLQRKLTTLLARRGRVTSKSVEALTGIAKHVLHWGWEDNVVGVAIGWKGSSQTQRCLRILVRRKLHESRLTRKQLVPTWIKSPRFNLNLPTDVVETGGSLACHGNLKLADEVAHQDGLGSGTLGYFVRPAQAEGPIMILSCSHVLARSGKARPALDFVEHPFVPFSNPAGFRVAQLTGDFTVFRPGARFREDVAFAQIVAGVNPQPEFRQLAPGRRPTTVSPLTALQFPQGFPVELFGQGVFPKSGRVLSAGSFQVNDENLQNQSVTIENAVEYSVDSDRGDSGGAVLQAGTNVACGLHFGGRKEAGIGLFLPLRPILQPRNLTLV